MLEVYVNECLVLRFDIETAKLRPTDRGRDTHRSLRSQYRPSSERLAQVFEKKMKTRRRIDIETPLIKGLNVLVMYIIEVLKVWSRSSNVMAHPCFHNRNTHGVYLGFLRSIAERQDLNSE